MLGFLRGDLLFFRFLRNFHFGHLDFVLEVVPGPLELAHALAKSACKLGDFLGPEEEEDDDEDNRDLRTAEATDERQGVCHDRKLIGFGVRCKEITRARGGGLCGLILA